MIVRLLRQLVRRLKTASLAFGYTWIILMDPETIPLKVNLDLLVGFSVCREIDLKAA